MTPKKFSQPLVLLVITSTLFVSLRTIVTQSLVVENTAKTIKCLERERQALLNFKKELIDDYGILSSWGDQETKRDCCKWKGIICHNLTNHVVQLDLHADYDLYDSRRYLRGNISPSLVELGELSYLDLSLNNFSYSLFPDFIGSLTKLSYLNLSNANLRGPIPPHLGNLTKLHFLDLSSSNYDDLSLMNLDWISPSLHSLEYLDLSFLNLSKATNWLQVLSTVTSLKALRLTNCDLPEIANPSSVVTSLANASTSLSSLDLSKNQRMFSSSGHHLIFNWFLNFSNSLIYIDLSSTSLEGSIPYVFQNMPILSHLDLSNNLIKDIPRFVGNMSNLIHLSVQGNSVKRQLSELMMNLSGPLEKKLEHLDLGMNGITGSLPNMSRYSSLTTLILEGNQLNGIIAEGFLQLPNLVLLDLYQNQITGQVPDLSSCTSLRGLYLYDNMFNGTLTESIGTLSRLEVLSLGLNQLEGTITEAHVANLSRLGYLDLSSNSKLTMIWNNSHFIPPFQLWGLTLAGCKLGPNFPKWIRTQNQLYFLDLSDAQLSDTISNLINNLPPTLAYLNASNNQINGLFPNTSFSIFNSPSVPHVRNWVLTQQSTLDLSRNNISGSIQFLCNCTKLNVIDLSHNLLQTTSQIALQTLKICDILI